MRDRIRPPREFENVLDRLKDDEGIFETKQKAIMFAAAVGYALYKETISTTNVDSFGEGIRLEYFRSPQDDGFIDALAVAHAGDLNILDPERQEERLELFERCSLLGLREMQKQCFDDRPSDPILGILALIDRMQKSPSSDLPGLDYVAEELRAYF